MWEWRRAKGRAINEAERLAWERDHPAANSFPSTNAASATARTLTLSAGGDSASAASAVHHRNDSAPI